MKKCRNCGQTLDNTASFCSVCGSELPKEQEYQYDNTANNYATNNNSGYSSRPNGFEKQFGQNNQNYGGAVPPGYVQKSRMLAGILGVFLGSVGVHNFYLDNIARGVIQIIVTLVTCGVGGIWGFIEGILILCRSINHDANNVPLKDDC